MADIATPGTKQFIGSLAKRRDESRKSTWHIAEETLYFPKEVALFRDIEKVSDEFLFSHFRPERPVFAPTDRLVTMGSCFADRIRRWLASQGKLADNIDVPSGLNNTFAVRQFIEWALTGNRSEDAYWYDKGDDGAYHWEAPEEHAFYKAAFAQAGGLVVTLGLSEVWRDRETGGVFWRGVPEVLFDVSRHEFVVSSVDDNAGNLRRIIRAVRDNIGDIPIVFTLSPVPLTATMRGISPIASDCVSKSILRVAVDMVMREEHSDVYYWPGFELVRWIGAHTDRATFGGDDTSRHPTNRVVKIIVDRFVQAFFGEELGAGGVEAILGGSDDSIADTREPQEDMDIRRDVNLAVEYLTKGENDTARRIISDVWLQHFDEAQAAQSDADVLTSLREMFRMLECHRMAGRADDELNRIA
ncbi:MAG: GSCFA domain-containing protein [Rhodospirillales bacterium]